MRTLLIGALAGTLIGCSCVLPPQANLNGCAQTGGFPCPSRTAEDPPVELKPSPTKVHSVRKETRSTVPKNSSSFAKADSRSVTAKAKSEIPAGVEDPPANQPAQASDSIIDKAKVTVAAKMENPASAEFQDMKRAIRTNSLRQSIDAICGHVKGKKASGEDTGEMPFLYLVKDDEAYIVRGGPETPAATAYRNICN
jgi:hypothetical protein